MAAQTYVTDLQVMNPAAVQNGAVVKTSGGGSQGGQQGQKTTIIQPAQAHTGQQFIVTTSSVDHQQLAEQAQQETITIQQGGQTVYPTHLQYVEGSDPGIYANGQMAKDLVLKARHNYGDYSQGTMYTNVSGTYYQTPQGTQNPFFQQVAQSLMPVGTSVQTLQGQIIQQGGTFLIQSGTVDGDGTPLTHTTRASPVTNHTPLAELSNLHTKEVQWLIDNYETAEGVSLPRSTLYYHYLRHCQEQGLDPMNPASFGKLIRSVFLGLRTRRLGTRGNSKYHYYGIRIRANSSLNQFTDDQTMALRQQPMYTSKKLANQKQEGSDGDSGQTGTQGGKQKAKMKVLLLLVASAFVAEGTITLNLPGRLEIPTLKINGGEPSIKFGSSGFSISTNGVAGKSGNSNTNQASVSFKFGTKLGNQGQGVGFGAGGALVPKRKKLRVKGGKKGKKVGVSKNAGAGVGGKPQVDIVYPEVEQSYPEVDQTYTEVDQTYPEVDPVYPEPDYYYPEPEPEPETQPPTTTTTTTTTTTPKPTTTTITTTTPAPTTTTSTTTTTTTPKPTTTTTTQPPPPPTPKPCTKRTKADIILLLDASTSIGKTNWANQVKFAAGVTENFNVGKDDVRFGTVIFNRNATKIFDLNKYFDHASMSQSLLGIKYPNNPGTYTDLGLQFITDDKMFSTASGGRDDANNILMVMTDGQSHNPALTAQAASALKALGTTIIAVGIGPDPTKTELNAIASKPEYVFLSEGYDMLDYIKRDLVSLTCDNL